MPVNNHDDEMNPAVADAMNSAMEEALSGLIGVSASSFKNAQSGLRLLKEKLDQHKEAKSQELKIQIGRKIVFRAKPGQKSETVMSPEQGKKLNQILQDPSKAEGSLKITFGKEKVLHISQGKILEDKLQLLHESQAQKQAETQKQPESQKQAEAQKKTETPEQAEVQKQAEAQKKSQSIPGLDNDFTPEQKSETLSGVNALKHLYKRDSAEFSRMFPATTEQLKQSEASSEAVIKAMENDLKPTQYPEDHAFLNQVREDVTTPHPIGLLADQVRTDADTLQRQTQELTMALKTNAPLNTINDSLLNTGLSKIRLQGTQDKAVKETQAFAKALVEQPELKENFPEFIKMHDDQHPEQSWGQQLETPVQSETSTQELADESPADKVLDTIDNAPGLVDSPTDPIAKQNQINEHNSHRQQPAQSPSKDEVIEQLRTQLQQQAESVDKLSEQVNQLSERMNNLSPIKLANEQLTSWVNQKRNAIANAIRTGADRLAQGIEKHNESTAKLTQDVKDTVDKFKAGMERHDEAVSQALDKVADTRDKVTENVTKVVEKTQEVAHQAKQTQQQVTDSRQYQKGVEFFKSVAEPAVRGVVNHLERIGGVTKDDQGNRTLESKNYNWTVTHDNQIQITNKETGQQVTPANLDQKSLNTIKTFASKAQQKGYVQTESQTQTQSPTQAQSPIQSQAPTPEAPKPVEAPKPAMKV